MEEQKDIFGNPINENGAPLENKPEKQKSTAKTSEHKERKSSKEAAPEKEPIHVRIRRISVALKVIMDQDPQGFYFWSLDKLLEGLKPLMEQERVTLVFSDDIQTVGKFNYVFATCTAISDDGEQLSVKAVAREDEYSAEGNYSPQLTGAAMTYAHKYALRNLFCPSAHIENPDDPDFQHARKGYYPGEGAAQTPAPVINTSQQEPAQTEQKKGPNGASLQNSPDNPKRELTEDEKLMRLGMWVKRQKERGVSDERILAAIRTDERIARPAFSDKDYDDMLATFGLARTETAANEK